MFNPKKLSFYFLLQHNASFRGFICKFWGILTIGTTAVTMAMRRQRSPESWLRYNPWSSIPPLSFQLPAGFLGAETRHLHRCDWKLPASIHHHVLLFLFAITSPLSRVAEVTAAVVTTLRLTLLQVQEPTSPTRAPRSLAIVLRDMCEPHSQEREQGPCSEAEHSLTCPNKKGKGGCWPLSRFTTKVQTVWGSSWIVIIPAKSQDPAIVDSQWIIVAYWRRHIIQG